MEEAVKYVLYSLMTAGLSLFFQKCMEPEMIFRRYYLWLIHHWIKWRKQKDRWKRPFLKPIGLCIYCYSTWISILSYIYLFPIRIEILLFIGLNYLWIETIKKSLSL